MTNLAIARLSGMTYHEVRDLPLAVYEVLVEDLTARHAQQEALA
jgi:hypothetical protein